MITDKEKQQAREERILLVANIIRNKLPFCVKHKQPGSVWKMSELPITAFTHATAWQVSTDMSLVEPARPPEEAETPDRRKERRIARLKMIATVIATDRNFEVRTKGPAPAAWFSTNMPVEHYADVDRFDLRLITNPSRPEIERIERLYPGFGDAFKSYQPPQFIILDEMIKLADGEIEKLKAARFKMTANGGCEHEVRARLLFTAINLLRMQHDDHSLALG